jgi:hypothetical protein
MLIVGRLKEGGTRVEGLKGETSHRTLNVELAAGTAAVPGLRAASGGTFLPRLSTLLSFSQVCIGQIADCYLGLI